MSSKYDRGPNKTRLPRLLVFVNSTVKAGVEGVIMTLLRGLRDDFELHLAAPPPLLEALREDLNGLPVKVFPLGFRSLRQVSDMGRLTKYVRRERIDIVNTHHFYSTMYVALAARLGGAQVVETVHGPDAWRTSWFKRTYIVDRLVEHLVSLNIAVSEHCGRYLREDKKYPARKVRVVPNAFDPASTRPASTSEIEGLRREFSLSAQDRVVVFVGRLELQKGHRHLVNALPAVVKSLPNLKILLVGDGSLRKDIEQQSLQMGCRDNLVFCGFRRDVTTFYEIAEFAVLSSDFEGMPLVALEAGGLGKALLATDVGGTGEVIIDGETGRLVPVNDLGALAQALVDMLDAPDKVRQMGLAAKKRVHEVYSTESQVRRTRDILLSCL